MTRTFALSLTLPLCACPIGDPFPDPPETPLATTTLATTTGVDASTSGDRTDESGVGSETRGDEPGTALGFLYVLDAEAASIHGLAYDDQGITTPLVSVPVPADAKALLHDSSERFLFVIGEAITAMQVDGVTGGLTSIAVATPQNASWHGAFASSGVLHVAQSIAGVEGSAVPGIETFSFDGTQLVSIAATPFGAGEPCVMLEPRALGLSPSGAHGLVLVREHDGCSGEPETCEGDVCSCGGGSAYLWRVSFDTSTSAIIDHGLVWGTAQSSGLRPRIDFLTEDRVLMTATQGVASDLFAYAVAARGGSISALGSATLGERVFGVATDASSNRAFAIGCNGTLGEFAIDPVGGTFTSVVTQGTGSVSHTLVIDPSRRFLFEISASTPDVGVWRLEAGALTLVARQSVAGMSAASHDAVSVRRQ
jgi:hypothetical protein